ncbi:hypothetical protein D3C78_1598920 [compost metagenome]
MRRAWPHFMTECVQELANRFLAKVVPRTPVGKYGDHWVEFTTRDGKEVKFFAKDDRKGGNLRRSWTLGQVVFTSAGVEIEVFNPVFYSAYIEYGHRTANHQDWVEGKFMMKISKQELERELPAIMERKMERFFARFIGG